MDLHPHGSYSLNFENDILHVEARGPFDKELMEKYHNDMQMILTNRKGSPWATLVQYHGNGIFTPDAESALVELTKYRAKKGMVANATVFHKSVHNELQQMQLSRVYQAANVRFHVFSEAKSAKNWLTKFLDQAKTN